MPEEAAAVATPAPEVDESWVDLASERRQRAEVEKKKTETPATAEPVKTAPVTEAGKSEEDEEAAEIAKLPGGVQRRIDKLTKARGDAERARDELQQKVTELAGRLESLEQKKPQVVADAKKEGDPEPNLNDYKGKDYSEYVRDLSKWVYRQEQKAASEATAKAETEQTQKEHKERQKAEFDKFLDGMRKVTAEHPGFLDKAKEANIPNYIHNRLVRMENGPQVAYALIQDQAALKRILDLNQKALEAGDDDFSEAYWEFGNFVRSLRSSSSDKKPEKPVSQAPAPITPVTGGAAPTEIDAEKVESVSEWRKLRGSGRVR